MLLVVTTIVTGAAAVGVAAGRYRLPLEIPTHQWS